MLSMDDIHTMINVIIVNSTQVDLILNAISSCKVIIMMTTQTIFFLIIIDI